MPTQPCDSLQWHTSRSYDLVKKIMGKPTDEELKAALTEAARMREHGEDPHFMAKSLLNLHYRLGHLEHVLQAADRYLHSGLAEHNHAELVRAIEAYKRAESRGSPEEGTEPWLS
jgi:hypothetical protein